jgi:nicotinate dehydrogenase subunit B
MRETDKRQTGATLILDRRRFLQSLGAGLFLFFAAGDPSSGQEARGPGQGLPADFNAFLRIGPDGRVTVFAGKVELGQGIMTALPLIAAEELDVSPSSVEMVMGDTDLCPYDMGTFGSRTIKYFGPALREAAAEARQILIDLASERLQRSPDRLIVHDGVVSDREYGAVRVSYGDLVEGKRIERHLGRKPSLKPVSSFTVSGRPFRRTDGAEKVTGRARFAGDIRQPGMLYARLLRPPCHGARLREVDVAEARKVKDVRVVREGDLVAVLHPSPDGAAEALGRIKARFDRPGPGVDDQTIFAHLLSVAPSESILGQGGDLETGQRLSKKPVEGTYLTRYVAHAPMEPHTAMASIEGKKVTIWASTQTPFGLKDEAARVLGVPAEDVRVIAPCVGGGFGGKSRNRQALEAVRLARIAGVPVQVAWTREEEFFYDTFQPAAVVKIRSGLDGRNRLALWDYAVYFAGERCALHFYDIPHHRTASHGSWWGGAGVHPFETGAWRGPASNTNTFAREAHIDRMAREAGADPLSFRIGHLRDRRMVEVLEKAASAFGWSSSGGSGGRGRGVACTNYLGTYVATMAEVRVDPSTGGVRVERVVCCQDMGRVINPDGARAQIEGGIVMGLGYALAEEIHFRGGEILDTNFDTYEIPRFAWVPRIETLLIDRPDEPPQGGGEPAITCVGGTLANAVSRAVGATMTELPMTPERVRKALAAVR